jgi:hypothetical protein
MTLVPGARLGAYEVLSLLGAGGMGEISNARVLNWFEELKRRVPAGK